MGKYFELIELPNTALLVSMYLNFVQSSGRMLPAERDLPKER